MRTSSKSGLPGFLNVFTNLSNNRQENTWPITAHDAVSTGRANVIILAWALKLRSGQETKFDEGSTLKKTLSYLLERHQIRQNESTSGEGHASTDNSSSLQTSPNNLDQSQMRFPLQAINLNILLIEGISPAFSTLMLLGFGLTHCIGHSEQYEKQF